MANQGKCIPVDIQREILLKLPLRSIAKFRKVCKLWKSITSDVYFIATHKNHDCDADSPCILILHKDRCCISVLDEACKPKYSLSNPSFDYIHYISACKNLICVSDYSGQTQLLNPTTGVCLTLPEPKSLGTSEYCLGFDPAKNECKVVHTYYNIYSTYGNHDAECEVYTPGNSSWRQIKIPDSILCSTGIGMDSVIYWIAIIKDEDRPCVLCLDLGSEKFSDISLPDMAWGPTEICFSSYALRKLGGKLCFVRTTKVLRTADMEIWMLDDNNNWIEKYTMTVPLLGPDSPVPIFISKEKILLRESSVLRYYDLTSLDKNLEEVYSDNSLECALEYFESLTPLTKL